MLPDLLDPALTEARASHPLRLLPQAAPGNALRLRRVRRERMGRMSAPRVPCTACGREIAVVNGHLARHDPPNRGSVLLSCPGSLRRVQLGTVQPSLLGEDRDDDRQDDRGDLTLF